LTAGIAAVLFIISVAGTLALTHSHPSSPTAIHSSTPPAATHVASPPTPEAASGCSRPQAPDSPVKWIQFDPPGAAEPAISCARAIATLLCSPHYGNAPCPVIHALPVKAQLVLFNATGYMGEVRGSGLPFIGPPFVPSDLLVWQLTFVPTVCSVDSTGVSFSDEPDFSILSTQVSTPCRTAFDYLIDASTDDFVFFDTPPHKAG
jgi:hypothetical protein